MDNLALDAESLFAIADVIDGYCAKQRETINVYYAQIMALESEWRDDETFGGIAEEIRTLKNKAVAVLDEIYNTYPKYFRKKAQHILERPIMNGGTSETIRVEEVRVPPNVSSYCGYTRSAGLTSNQGTLDTNSTFNSNKQSDNDIDQKICRRPILKMDTSCEYDGKIKSLFEVSTKKAGQIKLPQAIKDGKVVGKWTGELGNSMYIPLDKKRVAYLKYWGVEGILYVDNRPVFEEISNFEEISISSFTEKRMANFSQADEIFAKMKGVESSVIRRLRRTQRLTWHEVDAQGKMLLIPRELHDSFAHSGGISQYKAQQVSNAKDKIQDIKNLKIAKKVNLGGKLWKM